MRRGRHQATPRGWGDSRDTFEAVARKMRPSVVAIEAVKPTVKDGKTRSGG